MKKITIAVVGVFLVSGCATTGQDGSQGQNAAAGAAIGAVAGCVLAALAGEKCAKGAVIGATVGAVAGWSYESKKVATAESVNSQALQTGVKVPKNKIVLESYDITSNTNSIQQGDVVTTNSTIKLIGHSSAAPKIEETLVLVNPEGREGAPQVGKIASDGAGEYKSVGKFSIPKGFPQGKYTVKSALSLDGMVAANRSFKIQVAYIEGSQVIHLVSAK